MDHPYFLNDQSNETSLGVLSHGANYTSLTLH